MKQTAVEWLEFEINRRGPKEDNPPQWLKELYNHAKAMEKQQIMDAYLNDRPKAGIDKALRLWDEAEQYYNSTYNQ